MNGLIKSKYSNYVKSIHTVGVEKLCILCTRSEFHPKIIIRKAL